MPHHILDVGANEGNWADDAASNWAPDATFFQIEANKALEPFLQAKGNPYRIAIVGDEEKTVTFYKLCDGGRPVQRRQLRLCGEYQVRAGDDQGG